MRVLLTEVLRDGESPGVHSLIGYGVLEGDAVSNVIRDGEGPDVYIAGVSEGGVISDAIEVQ